MASLTKAQVLHIADLAKLKLTVKEVTKFRQQLSETLDYINKLEEIETSKIDPTDQVSGLTNMVRDDEVGLSLSQEDCLSQAKSIYNGYFKVGLVLNKN